MKTYIAAFLLTAVTITTAHANVLVPDGLQPGDMYHLVFVTEGTRDATSTDIADYNAFVQAEAERPGAITENFGIEWFAIGSTATVDARDNAVVEAPVYLLDGLTEVESDPYGFFIYDFQFKYLATGGPPVFVLSGSQDDGIASHGEALGDPNPRYTNPDWFDTFGFAGFPMPADTLGHMYALSKKLTMPIREPTTIIPGDSNLDMQFSTDDIIAVLAAGVLVQRDVEFRRVRCLAG